MYNNLPEGTVEVSCDVRGDGPAWGNTIHGVINAIQRLKQVKYVIPEDKIAELDIFKKELLFSLTLKR